MRTPSASWLQQEKGPVMGDSSKDRLNKRAEKAFKPAERRDTTSKQITETEHATTAAKTKTLRAMRLAKEAADATDKGKKD